MSTSPSGESGTLPPSGPSRAELADAVAVAVRAVPGVADLHAGVFGEVGTYLPGRRVAGISIGSGGAEVHVALLTGYPMRETAAMVRSAVAPLTGGPVHVTVEDVVAETPDPSTPPGPPEPVGPPEKPELSGGAV